MQTDSTLDERLRNDLVATLIADGKIRAPSVAEAFRTVPRHLFVPGTALTDAYRDDVIFTKSRDGISLSALSAPSIMASMLDLLDVRPGHRVLEIGAGTGYNAALLETLVGPEGRVVTIDIDEDIVAGARASLAAAGRGERVTVVCGDGAFGWTDGAPYDRAIVTVGAWDLAPAWLDQLVEGGRLVVPLEIRDVHKLVSFERRAGRLMSQAVTDCRFVQMRGALASPERQVPLDIEGMYVSTQRTLDPGRISAAIHAGGRTVPLRAPLGRAQLLGSFRLWLAVRCDLFCLVSMEREALEQSPVRGWHTTSARFASAPGLLADAGLALLEPDAGGERAVLRLYGSPGDLEQRTQALLEEWHREGRPFEGGLQIEAVDLKDRDAVPPASKDHVVDKRWFRLKLRPLNSAR